jgi:DNA-binding response OmpR family regulator
MPARVPLRGKPLILHVEDDQAQSAALKAILEGNGFSVIQAGTAEEALELCRESPVSLVLADHMLSGTTGSDVAGRLKSLKPTVPVVLHSGAQPVSMLHLDGFIHKGESVRDLVAFLGRLIERSWE